MLTSHHSIGSDNGLVPKRHQAITWTNEVMHTVTKNDAIFLSENILIYFLIFVVIQDRMLVSQTPLPPSLHQWACYQKLEYITLVL